MPCSYVLDLFYKYSNFGLNRKIKMFDINKNLIIANTDERFFVWMPPKTASVTASLILPKLGFKCYRNNGKHLEPVFMESIHNHSTNFFYGHEDYSFITTLRNPYSLLSSKYIFFGDRKELISHDDFIQYLENYFYGREDELKYLQCYNHSERIPDYVIRVENMFEDYLKIPFVVESKLNHSGELSELCGIKNNSTHSKITNWKLSYNQTSADIVYYNFAHIFELGGYDRNSWK
jgi:hypothetical protein